MNYILKQRGVSAYRYMNIDTACFEGMKTARGLLNGKMGENII